MKTLRILVKEKAQHKCPFSDTLLGGYSTAKLGTIGQPVRTVTVYEFGDFEFPLQEDEYEKDGIQRYIQKTRDEIPEEVAPVAEGMLFRFLHFLGLGAEGERVWLSEYHNMFPDGYRRQFILLCEGISAIECSSVAVALETFKKIGGQPIALGDELVLPSDQDFQNTTQEDWDKW